MMKIIFAAIFAAASLGAFAQELNIASVTLNGDKRLSAAMSEEELMKVDSVTLKGNIMLADFKTLREMTEHGRLTGIDLSGTDCVSIPDMAFLPSKVNSGETKGYRTNLHYITFPERLLKIGARAFELNDLRMVTLPGSLVHIGNGAFDGCRELKSVKVCSPYIPRMFLKTDVFTGIPKDAVLEVPTGSSSNYNGDERWQSFGSVVENAGLFVTRHVNLDGITLAEAMGDGLLTTDSLVVTGCLMKSDNAALYDAIRNGRLRSVDMSGATTENDEISIVGTSMGDCSRLRYFRFPETTRTIRNSFNHARFLDLRLPESLRSIDFRAFLYTTVYGDLRIPEGVTKIGEMAFRTADIQGNLYLPSTLSDIYILGLDFDYSFDYPSSWSVYINRMVPPAYGKGASISHTNHPFDGLATNELPASWTLYVPVGTADAYKKDKCWGCFKNIVETAELDGGTTAISAVAKDNCSNIATRVYTLDGRYVGTDVDRLGKGVYVVNGKKIVK